MSLEWVRKRYRVPAKRGGRVEYTGEKNPQLGTICGASGGHLSIRLDGVKHTMPFHPTWELRYLNTDTISPSDREERLPREPFKECEYPKCNCPRYGRCGNAVPNSSGQRESK